MTYDWNELGAQLLLEGQSFIPVVSIFKQKLRGSIYEAISEDY